MEYFSFETMLMKIQQVTTIVCLKTDSKLNIYCLLSDSQMIIQQQKKTTKKT